MECLCPKDVNIFWNSISHRQSLLVQQAKNYGTKSTQNPGLVHYQCQRIAGLNRVLITFHFPKGMGRAGSLVSCWQSLLVQQVEKHGTEST